MSWRDVLLCKEVSQSSGLQQMIKGSKSVINLGINEQFIKEPSGFSC